MKNTITKLQSKRGASIMLALLLLLVCLLAGIASLTAASANMGRHSYMRETQQKYLAVSSAAKLIREQLDGVEIRGKYVFTATEWNVPTKYNPDGEPDGDYSITEGEVKSLYDLEYRLDDDPNPSNTILDFFKGDSGLDGMIVRALKAQITQTNVPWTDWINVPTASIQSEYDFTIECDGIENGVTVHIEITDADGSYASDKDFKISVSCEGYEYSVEMEGKITLTVPSPEITESEFVGIALDPSFPDNKTLFEKIYKSEQKSDTVVKFTVEDNYTRKAKATVGGGGNTP